MNRAYEVLGLPPAREFTRKFADYTLANGWDNIHGGIYRDGMHDGRIVVTDKEWWQNFESLTGFLDSYQATEDELSLIHILTVQCLHWHLVPASQQLKLW